MRKAYAVIPLDVPYEEVQEAVDMEDLVKGEVQAAIFESEVLDPEGLVKAVQAIEDPETGPDLCKLAGIELVQDPNTVLLREIRDLVKSQGDRISVLEKTPQPRRGTLVPQRNEGGDDLTKSQPGDTGADARTKLAAEVLGCEGTWEEAMRVMTTEATAAGGPHNLPPPRRELHKRMIDAAYDPGGAPILAPLDFGPSVTMPEPAPGG